MHFGGDEVYDTSVCCGLHGTMRAGLQLEVDWAVGKSAGREHGAFWTKEAYAQCWALFEYGGN